MTWLLPGWVAAGGRRSRPTYRSSIERTVVEFVQHLTPAHLQRSLHRRRTPQGIRTTTTTRAITSIRGATSATAQRWRTIAPQLRTDTGAIGPRTGRGSSGGGTVSILHIQGA